VGNYTAGTVGILLGDGTGSFAPQVTYATRPSLVSMSSEDFNNDGAWDLVVGSEFADASGAGRLVVLLGDGAGAFNAQPEHPLAGRPRGIAAGDFNGDGFFDFAASEYETGALKAFINQGQAVFGPPVVTAGMPGVYGMSAGDFDGDQRTDLAASNLYGSSTNILLSVGNGTFGPEQLLPAGRDPLGSAVADLNLDGKNDVVTVNHTGNSLSVLLNSCAP
jgi:FG-GAP-like repeat